MTVGIAAHQMMNNNNVGLTPRLTHNISNQISIFFENYGKNIERIMLKQCNHIQTIQVQFHDYF
jgi:hypothetical protein